MALMFLLCAGLLGYQLFRNIGGDDRLERGFLCTLSVVLFVSVVSLALTRIGAYSLGTVSAGCLLGSLFLSRTQDAPSSATTAGDAPLPDRFALAMVLGLGLFYAAFPVFYLFAGRDFGPYLIFTEHIATTGGLDLDLPFMRDVVERWGPREEMGGLVRQDYPAFYSMHRVGLSDDHTQIAPQFQHLWPALAANAYGLFGFAGVARVNAILGAMGIWALYMTGRRLVGSWVALGVAFVVGINPAVIWAARISLTEALALLMLFGGAFALQGAVERRCRRMAVLAGLALGAAVACRLDGTFAVLWLLGAILAYGEKQELRPVLRTAMTVYATTATAALLDCRFTATPYWMDLWADGSVMMLVGMTVVGIFGGLLYTALPMRWRELVGERLLRPVLTVALLGLAAWISFGLTVRPQWEEGFYGRAMGELGMYTTIPALFLAVLGGLVSLRSPDWKRMLPLIAFIGVSWFAFTWRPSISPDHIWASRRWVPSVIPGILLMAGALFGGGYQRGFQRSGVLLGAASVFGMSVISIQNARPFAFESMGERLPADIAALAEGVTRLHTGPDPVVTDDVHLAAFLNYTHDVPTVIRMAPLDISAASALEGTLFVAKRRTPYLKYHSKYEIRSKTLDTQEGALPTRVHDRVKELHVGHVQVPGSETSSRTRFAASQLATPGMRQANGDIQSSGTAGTLQNGPWVQLDPGTYQVNWYGEVRTGGRVLIDIPSASGAVRHASLETIVRPRLAGRPIASLAFALEERVEDVEFRMVLRETEIDMAIHSVELIRLGSEGPTIFAASELSTPRERDADGFIVSDGTTGTLQNGPFVSLEAGAYIVEWHGNVRNGGRALVDIPSAKGAQRYGSLETTLAPNKDDEAFATLAFTLSEPVPDLEFRLIIRDPAMDLTLERIELTRLAAP